MSEYNLGAVSVFKCRPKTDQPKVGAETSSETKRRNGNVDKNDYRQRRPDCATGKRLGGGEVSNGPVASFYRYAKRAEREGRAIREAMVSNV